MRHVLVTGAASGIGAAIARAFGSDACALSLIDVDALGLSSVERSVATLGGTGLCAAVDVTDTDVLEVAVARFVNGFGLVDVVCANAGVFIGPECPLAEVDDTTLERLLSINVGGVVKTLRSAIPVLRDGASLVVTSSTSGLDAHPGAAVYAATKIGLLGLVRSVAAELAPRRIRVNAVCPGGVRTPLLEAASPGLATEAVGEYTRTNPMGRIAEPEDVAAAVRWLASEGAAHITGAELRIDGGHVFAGQVSS